MRFASLGIVIPAVLGAQSATFKGRALTDSLERPIPGVVVAIDQLKLQATTDSLGNFEIKGVTPGGYTVTAKKIGFGPLGTRLRFTSGETLDADLLLTPTTAQTLPDVKVETKAPTRGKLIEFDERRQAGQGGHFLTQADIERHAFSNFENVLRTLPGISFAKDLRRSSAAYAVAGRMSLPGGALARGGGGPPPPCYAAVVLDGTYVYGAGDDSEPKFDLNSINPQTIAGVEYYVGAATIPVKYNATRSTCGLLVIWTK